MNSFSAFLRDCLWLLWMVFFRPKSFRLEVERFDRQQKRRLVAQALVITIVTPFLIITLIGLLLEAMSIPFDFLKNLSGLLFSVAAGVLFSVAFGVLFGVAAGVAFGVAAGVAFGVVTGVALGVVAGVASIISYSRLFLLPIEVPTTLLALLRAKRQPSRAAQFLHQSLAYWDEVVLFPQPFLTPLLVLVGEQDRKTAMDAIVHLATRTFQRRAAVNALLELSNHDLLRRRSILEIAQLAQTTDWLSSDVAIDKRIEETLQKRGVMEASQRCFQISANVGAALSATSHYQQLTAFNRVRRQLDGLRKFAVLGLRRRESQVFAQIAQQWLDAVNVEIDRLTEEEHVTESIPNPYIAPSPLLPDSDVFVGRTDVFRFVEEHFLRADQSIPIVLHGQPRIGKSSILKNFSTHLTTNLIPVYVDMQRAAQVESTGGLLFNLADTIGQALARRRIRLIVLPLSDYATEPFIVFGKFLDMVETEIHAPENRIILALDEFEEIEKKLTEGKVSQDLMPFLRSMMQHRQGIALLFAGTHTLDEMIQDYWIPYFRSAVPCKVSYLHEADARQLITNPIEEFSLDYEPEAVEFLIEATHCHPCLIQLTCSALVDQKNQQRSRYASVEDVKQVLAKTLETGDYVFQGVWDWIPPHEREVLSVLASEEQVTIEHLMRARSIPEGKIRRMIERLTEAEVIEGVTPKNNTPAYRFQVELFRQWVERHTARVGVGLRINNL